MEKIKSDLKTGDIILFDAQNKGPFFWIVDKLIKLFTSSKYTHIGMILKDPIYFNEKLEGLYVWESGWEGIPDPQDDKIKLGVQITPLEEMIDKFPGQIYIRKIECDLETYSNTFNDINLKKIHEIVHNKPYDLNPLDWIKALFRSHDKEYKTNTFWCSAFVGFIYNQLGIIDKDIDWTLLRPSDFSLEDNENHIELNENYKLSNYQIEFNSN